MTEPTYQTRVGTDGHAEVYYEGRLVASVTHHDNDTHTASRVLVGHCPDCERPVVVFNNYGTWAVVHCSCGWIGQTLTILNRQYYERFGVVAS